VKLLWSREEEIRQGRYRHKRLSGSGGIDAKEQRLRMTSAIRRQFQPASRAQWTDPQTTQGLITTAYKLPKPARHQHHQEHACAVGAMARGRATPRTCSSWKAHRTKWRSLRTGSDKIPPLAAAHRADFQQVLDVLESKSDWGKPMRPAGTRMAIHESFDSSSAWSPRSR